MTHPMPNIPARYLPWLALILILGASAALYVPWIDNPLVFDDPNILKSPVLGDYAIKPFSLQPRQFPYFTLGFEQVISNGNLHVSRYVALMLHGLNGFLLFLLGRRLLGRVTESHKANLLALGAGLLFVVHPVSVYAAGYLVQRTILFATGFLLLSAIQFDKALEGHSWRRAIFAGICYGMAVMSKEHAITGLLSVFGLLFLHRALNPKDIRHLFLAFGLSSLPVALWVVSIKLGLVATAYEPDAENILNSVEFPNAGSRIGNWGMSVAWQCNFFFEYVRAWLWPDPRLMSIDIRPDLASMTQLSRLFLPPLAFCISICVTAWVFIFSETGNAKRIASFGFLWTVTLFLVELSTIRIQEPIVLYRSYLWAPGILIAIAAIISQIPIRFLLPTLIASSLLTTYMSWDRLQTASSPLSLWEDAARKLSNPEVPSAARIYNNRGLLRLGNKNFQGAANDFSTVIKLAPKSPMGYIGRSHAYIAQHEYAKAEAALREALILKPDSGYGWLRLGFLLEFLERHTEAEIAFSNASALGFPPIRFGGTKHIELPSLKKDKAP